MSLILGVFGWVEAIKHPAPLLPGATWAKGLVGNVLLGTVTSPAHWKVCPELKDRHEVKVLGVSTWEKRLSSARWLNAVNPDRMQHCRPAGVTNV